MTSFEVHLEKILDTFFHLPTLISLALLGGLVIWWLYALGVDYGPHFIRFTSNQGNFNLYWMDGCCKLSW